jgi:hypothetical protein
MLGNRSLGNGQMIDNVAGNASGMGHQKFDDLKPDGVSEGFEHIDQALLGFAANI